VSLEDDIRLGERAEVAAMTDLIAAASIELVHSIGLKSWTFDCASALTATNLSEIWFNRVYAIGVEASATADALADIDGELQGAVGDNYAFQLTPLADSPEIRATLQARGLQFTNNWVRLLRSTGEAPSVDSSISVEETTDAEVFARLVCAGFGVPAAFAPMFSGIVGRDGWRCYVGLHGGQPVATAAMFVRGDIGWLGFAATLPEARNRGAQSALIARRIADAASMGVTTLAVEVQESTNEHPNPSYFNLVRLGFRVAYLRGNWESR
jgi:hypothetical protein